MAVDLNHIFSGIGLPGSEKGDQDFIDDLTFIFDVGIDDRIRLYRFDLRDLFDDVKTNFKIYVINKETKIISEISEITPIEINYTTSIVRFELISDTNFGIKLLNLSLNKQLF